MKKKKDPYADLGSVRFALVLSEIRIMELEEAYNAHDEGAPCEHLICKELRATMMKKLANEEK